MCLPPDRVVQRVALLDALISDASPWDDRLLADVRAWRAQNPYLPILFVLPPTPVAVGFAPRLASLPAVGLHIAQGDASVDDGLGVQLHSLLRGIPTQAVLRLVRSVFPNAPREFECVASTAIASLRHGSKASVASVAGLLGRTDRWLERLMVKHRLPRPKELLDWITLAYIAACSDWWGQSALEARAAAGLDSVAFRRLCARRGVELDIAPDGRSRLPVTQVLAVAGAACTIRPPELKRRTHHAAGQDPRAS